MSANTGEHNTTHAHDDEQPRTEMFHGKRDAAIEIRPITDRATWLDWRRQNVNASEIAACFGLHPYLTLAQLVALKRGLDVGPNPDNALLRRGNALEDDAADEVRKQRPSWNITKCNNYYVDHKHRTGSTPDFIAIDPARDGFAVVQIKIVAEPVYRRDYQHGTPPYHVILQTAAEMLVTDAAWGAIAALEIGDYSFNLHLFPIERHRDAEARLIAAVTEFWRAFDADEQPIIDYERDGKLIALLYPAEVPGKIADLSGDNSIVQLLETREVLRETAADISKRLEATETEIKSKLRDAEAAIVPGWRLSFKVQRRKSYEVAATSFRVLRCARSGSG